MIFGFILDLWDKWNIRGLVVLSFTLQVFLILFAPLTKKIVNHGIFLLVWLAYLIANWIAVFTIGLVSHNQGNSSTCIAKVDGALQAFWTSILLLHLGGPDTITAFALEDNSLWGWHLLNLIFQVGASIYVFVQVFTSDKSLATPTMLVFLAAVIKNVESILALNLSSFPRLRESMISQLDYALSNFSRKEWDEALNVLGDGYPEVEARFAESIVVRHAHDFFEIIKVFLRDLIFTCEQRKMSRKYFRKISVMDALRVISVELHFIYEVLCTKVLVTRSKWGCIFRFIAFTGIVVAFILFNRFKKHRLFKLDVKITYILLSGGIALDVIALYRFIFSDWTVAKIMGDKTGSSKQDSFLYKLISIVDDLRKPRFVTYKVEPNPNVSYVGINTPLIFRRWSESISACNLFSKTLEESSRKTYKCHRHWGIVAFSKICSFTFCMAKKTISCSHQAGKTIARGCNLKCRELMFVSKNPFVKEVWIFIFQEMRRRSENIDVPAKVREIYEARGAMFLKSRDDCGKLLHFVIDFN
ncbi:hypothetical protein ACJRO7_000218 [Eucalyptus globulus]|uniref:DUF4220 domain-containing protein n=1 Tax=Eucalyptus globulus TaxID=34317 RepID=A0ABD3LLW5_EUCGL